MTIEIIQALLLIGAAFFIGLLLGPLLFDLLNAGKENGEPVAAAPARPAMQPSMKPASMMVDEPEPQPVVAPKLAPVAPAPAPVPEPEPIPEPEPEPVVAAAPPPPPPPPPIPASPPPADAAKAAEADAVGSRPPGLVSPDGDADNLKRVKGIGPKNEEALNSLGIYHFRQIAAWSPDEVSWVGQYLAFPGRIDREEWVSQATVLATGGDTAFAKRVDKGEVESSQ